jgi:hypothetical protein
MMDSEQHWQSDLHFLNSAFRVVMPIMPQSASKLLLFLFPVGAAKHYHHANGESS